MWRPRKEREAIRSLRKSPHKITLKSTLWAKSKQETVTITRCPQNTPIPFGKAQKINEKKKKLPVHAIELLTVDRPLARLWVFAENLEDTKSSMPSSVSSKES